jgi:hypothetical protein
MYVLAYTYQDNIDSVIHSCVCNSYKEAIYKLTQVAQSISNDNNFPTNIKDCLTLAHQQAHCLNSHQYGDRIWNDYFVQWFDYVNSYGMHFNYSIEEFEIGVIK